MRSVGSLDLVEMRVIGASYRRSELPYPLMLTQRSPFGTAAQASEHAAAVMEQFSIGDLSRFVEYMATLAAADIWVSYHVQYIPDDTPSQRVIAHRRGTLGFLAEQRTDADVVDVYSLSAYDLSIAICDVVPFTQPGRHAEIVVPEYRPRPRVEFDTGDFVVSQKFDEPTEVIVPGRAVSAYATVQSHWSPMQRWGVDPKKQALVWIQVDDDGDYLYEPDMSIAKPMTRSALRERIDLLIAEDVLIVKRLRQREEML
jgi:hypothetical protein